MLITNIGRLVTMEPAPNREGALGVIRKAAIAIEGDKIAWVGPETDLPIETKVGEATAVDADGAVVMPGLVDCHTHLVHAGSREREFVKRARGETYQAIAQAGGGILSTVKHTREATHEQLLGWALARAGEALSRGTTTIEIKSGYGLDMANELKILHVVRDLNRAHPIHCVATFLGAHTLPEEFRDDRAGYVDLVIKEMIPAVAQEELSEFCDVFVEEGAFTADEARRICAAGQEHGLQTRLHVDQFHDVGGGGLAAEIGAVSADHLDAISPAGIAAMAQAGVVAGILPAASFFTGKGKYPPLGQLINAEVPLALATDYNPGTAPTLDLFLCGTIAVTQMGLDPDVVLRAMTLGGAQALGRHDRIGSLAPGKDADVLMLACRDEYYPLYRFGHSSVQTLICHGEIVWGAAS